MNPKGRRLIDI